jgi:hypothetical protein
MDKLQLNLDDLSVDSFHLDDADDEPEGTVQGQADTNGCVYSGDDCGTFYTARITCIDCSMLKTACANATCDDPYDTLDCTSDNRTECLQQA